MADEIASPVGLKSSEGFSMNHHDTAARGRTIAVAMMLTKVGEWSTYERDNGLLNRERHQIDAIG